MSIMNIKLQIFLLKMRVDADLMATISLCKYHNILTIQKAPDGFRREK